MQQKVPATIAAHLAEGEQMITGTRALAGAFDASRLGTIAVASLKNQGLVGHALSRSKKQFVVVTDRRVLFLNQTFLNGGPGKNLLAELPRAEVTLAEAKLGTVSILRLAFGADGDGISLTFPLVDKKKATALAEALKQPAAAA
jgi:hypothetical protein